MIKRKLILAMLTVWGLTVLANTQTIGYCDHELASDIQPLGIGDGEQQASQATTFYVYESAYPRTLLLEHFTSLPCVNCPPVDRKLEEVVAGRSDVAWVSHHVGYKNDEFTLAAENALIHYGVNGNPYIMLDRTAFNEGEPPADHQGGQGWRRL